MQLSRKMCFFFFHFNILTCSSCLFYLVSPLHMNRPFTCHQSANRNHSPVSKPRLQHSQRGEQCRSRLTHRGIHGIILAKKHFGSCSVRSWNRGWAEYAECQQISVRVNEQRNSSQPVVCWYQAKSFWVLGNKLKHELNTENTPVQNSMRYSCSYMVIYFLFYGKGKTKFHNKIMENNNT